MIDFTLSLEAAIAVWRSVATLLLLLLMRWVWQLENRVSDLEIGLADISDTQDGDSVDFIVERSLADETL